MILAHYRFTEKGIQIFNFGKITSLIELAKLLFPVLIRSNKDAIYETVGNIMGKHGFINRYLRLDNYIKEKVSI